MLACVSAQEVVGRRLPHLRPQNLLAVLVPGASLSFGGLSHSGRHTTFAALWRALHGPGSVAMVVADEFCVEGLFHRELGSPAPPPSSPLRGDDALAATEEERSALRWTKPVLRNYW